MSNPAPSSCAQTLAPEYVPLVLENVPADQPKGSPYAFLLFSQRADIFVVSRFFLRRGESGVTIVYRHL